MAELELIRTSGDRRLYELAGVGTLRIAGRGATAEAGGRRWQIRRSGFWRSVIQATDAAGGLVGEFTGRAGRGGGALRWSGRELQLRRDGTWRSRYVLLGGGRELATIEATVWGRRAARARVDDDLLADPGLLLFAAFVVRALAAAAAAAAS